MNSERTMSDVDKLMVGVYPVRERRVARLSSAFWKVGLEKGQLRRQAEIN